MMVVVTLIALFAAFAIPQIGSYFRASLGAAAREMASVKKTYNATILRKTSSPRL